MDRRWNPHSDATVDTPNVQWAAAPTQTLRKAVHVLADVKAEVALVGPVGNHNHWTWAHQPGLQRFLHPLSPRRADPPREGGPAPPGQLGMDVPDALLQRRTTVRRRVQGASSLICERRGAASRRRLAALD